MNMQNQTRVYARRAAIARAQESIELSWCKKYGQFLDFNGREPQPINERSLALILGFFVLSWGLATWQGMVHLIPAITLTCIVSVASIRFHEFNRAYQQYYQRRAELMSLETKSE
jgi:CHASE2 domain-containing sensor protein